MENIENIKSYDSYRPTLKAVSDGYVLMRHSMPQLLWVFWPLLLVLSLSGAWMSVELMACETLSLPGMSFLFSSILYLLAILVFMSAFFNAWGYFRVNGFIPQMEHRTFWVKVLKGMAPTMIVFLWGVFIAILWMAISYYFVTLSKYTLVITLPLSILIGILYVNEAVDYLPFGKEFYKVIIRSAKVTFKSLGSMLSMWVLLTIVYSLLILLCSLPVLVFNVIENKAHISAAFGDGSYIPGYFIPVSFIVCMISVLLQWIAISVLLSMVSMAYGAAVARIREKAERTVSQVKEK